MKLALPIIKHLGILFIMTLAISFANGATITSSATGNWSATGTWVGGVVPGAGDDVIIAGSNNVTIDVNTAACASLEINKGTANNTSTITFNSGSVLTVSGIVTIGGTSNAKGSIDMTNGGTLSVQQFTISKAGTWTAGTGTVQFTATNTLPTTFFTTFNNLSIGAGTTSMSVTLTLNGNLSISDGATFTEAGFGLTVNGTTTVGGGTSGVYNITASGGTKIFVGLVTIDAGGTWNNSANSAVTFKGGITNNGTFTSGTGIHTFSINAQALTGTFTISSMTVTGVVLTNNNTLTVSTALSGTGGTLVQASNAVLNIGSLSAITTLTATATGNIVNYTGTGNQTVNAGNYYALNLSGAGTKTLRATGVAVDLTVSGAAKATTGANLTIGGNLVIGDGTTFTAAAFALTVSGTTTIGAGTSGTFNASSATGTKTFVGLITINAGGIWTNTGNSAIEIQGSINYSGTTFTSGNGIYTFDTNNQSITGAITISNVTVTGITLTNNNTFTISTALTGTGTLLQTANATLNLKGTTTAITTLDASSIGNTVNYTGTNQNIYGINYYNLTLSGSGTDTLSASTATINNNLTLSGTVRATTFADLQINGNLSVGDGTIFTAAAFALTVNGTTTVGSGTSGNMTISSATGTKTFVGLIRINTGATWNNSGNSAITLLNGINHAGTTFTSGSGIYTFSTNDQSITGTVTITNITVTGITLTNNNTLTVSTALAGTGTLLQAANSTLNLKGTTTAITTLNTASTGNTVNYSGTTQTVRGMNYYHLTLSGSGTKTLQTTTTTIAGNFTTSGTASTTAVIGLTISGNIVIGGTLFSAGSFTHNVAGNWQFNAGTFTRGTSTINFNGSSAQTIGGSKATVFNNLTINNANGVSFDDGTNSVNKTVNAVLTLTNGLLTTTSSNLLVLANGASTSATVPDPVGNPNYYTATSYVNGPLQATIGSTGLTFAIGKSGTGYVPIAISALFGSSPVPQTFTAEYFHASAQTMGPINVGSPQLTWVSGCDYWRLDLGATYPASTNSTLPNGVTTNITMYWNPNNSAGCSSSYVTSTTSLVIAHLDFATGQTYQGLWSAVGGSYNFTGSTTNGSISYVGASKFSPFTLGTINGTQNPLDIKLDYFTATKASGYNKLSWKAECSTSSNIFEAQRSTDGINFSSIDTEKVDAQSDCSKGFVYNDYSITDSKIYYRIKTTDVSGNIGYSDIKLITAQSSTFEFIGINPNPVRSDATLNISAAQNEKIELAILSIDGRELQHKSLQLQSGTNTISLQTSQLPKGMYFIKGIFPSGEVNTIKFIKE